MIATRDDKGSWLHHAKIYLLTGVARATCAQFLVDGCSFRIRGEDTHRTDHRHRSRLKERPCDLDIREDFPALCIPFWSNEWGSVYIRRLANCRRYLSAGERCIEEARLESEGCENSRLVSQQRNEMECVHLVDLERTSPYGDHDFVIDVSRTRAFCDACGQV